MLEVRNISRSFGGVRALSSINFQIEANQISGLIGPNGAGKTTLFQIISGHEKADTGNILWNGKDITGMNPAYLAKLGMARTFQNIRLFGSMTVREQVMMGFHIQRNAGFLRSVLRTKYFQNQEELFINKTNEILEFLKLTDCIDKPSLSLSYGQQRRVEIGRCLAMNPTLLLLDEPAAGMTDRETLDLMEILSNLKERQISILLVEHDMHLVMNLCDKITCINFGSVIADGTPREVRDHPAVMEAYLG